MIQFSWQELPLEFFVSFLGLIIKINIIIKSLRKAHSLRPRAPATLRFICLWY